eukprot:TRINITY_DN18495_c0_g1_i1.p1 TRINITY_DN18495_c0_g1~~TRINITY_DN18495_c0_g1_i1.p1  ORF type:complete len:1019 (-),score=169.32 TRINITY_DN18495_c0_g1_i1:61-3117(-)
MLLGRTDWSGGSSQVEWSLLSVGGFLYLRVSPEAKGAPQVLCANSIAFAPRGCVQFSSPVTWDPEFTVKLGRAGRFQKVTIHKWAAVGARYFAWVCPEEKLLAPRALYGGFAVLFHELDEQDTTGLDRFFEVVPSTTAPETGQSLGDHGQSFAGYPNQASVPKLTLQTSTISQNSTISSMPFRVIGETPSSTRVSESAQRFFRAANERRWALVVHLLTEFPQLAKMADHENQTALHKIAVGRASGRRARELLHILHSFGANLNARDVRGARAYELGDITFKALACQLWGLIPDLFADPEVWFDYWDRNKDGHLNPQELTAALTAAYRAGELGQRWIETYVNTHYRELAALDPNAVLTKHALLGSNGLLQKLQSSEEFISLRDQEDSPGKKMPAMFRTELRKFPTANDQEAMARFGKAMERLRRQYGWVIGKPPPDTARPLSVRAAFAGGDCDVCARRKAAMEMLAWSFAKTTARSGEEWRQGFKIAFEGKNEVGIDQGGLTKAWVNEIAFALWSDDSFFDTKDQGSFFKPDTTTDVLLHCFHVKTESLYRWVGRFLAYAVYQNCLLDCRLCPWAMRWLLRVLEAQQQVPRPLTLLAGDWEREDGSGRVATIFGSVMLAPSGGDDAGLPTEIPLNMHGNEISAVFEGNHMMARFESGKLHWNDGDVWQRCAEAHMPRLAALPSWPETKLGDDHLLADLATMDPAFANSLWRVQYEMPDEDLQWLTFSYAGMELESGGDDREVDSSNKDRYVRLCAKAVLLFQSQKGLQAFSDGFFDVLPPELASGAPLDLFRWLLLGTEEISDGQLNALERVVLQEGLVPSHLSQRREVRANAEWVFRIARASDSTFRTRLLEFWTGSSRLPQGGADAIEPKPRLQVMVQEEKQAAKTVRIWEVQVNGQGWRPYHETMSLNLSQMRDAGMRTAEFGSGRQTLVFDLSNMVQINKASGARSKIRCREERIASESTGPSSLKRIDAWPRTRLPEGHTCGNELWVPLCDSQEELARLLHMSVMNFEAGFAMA